MCTGTFVSRLSPSFQSWFSRWDPACWPIQLLWLWSHCCLPSPPASHQAAAHASQCGMSSRWYAGSPISPQRSKNDCTEDAYGRVCARRSAHKRSTYCDSVPLGLHWCGLVGVLSHNVCVCVLHIRAVDLNVHRHGCRVCRHVGEKQRGLDNFFDMTLWVILHFLNTSQVAYTQCTDVPKKKDAIRYL